jgi:hypothetical protein
MAINHRFATTLISCLTRDCEEMETLHVGRRAVTSTVLTLYTPNATMQTFNAPARSTLATDYSSVLFPPHARPPDVPPLQYYVRGSIISEKISHSTAISELCVLRAFALMTDSARPTV